MKKILLILSLVLLTACGTQEKKEDSPEYQKTQSPIVEICRHGNTNDQIVYLRDTITDNVYIKTTIHYGYGAGTGLSPYYREDGSIMKYNEFIQYHNCGEVE